MTKKHFKLLAEMMVRHHRDISIRAFKSLVEDMASVCQITNPNFDRQRFIEACYEDYET